MHSFILMIVCELKSTEVAMLSSQLALTKLNIVCGLNRVNTIGCYHVVELLSLPMTANPNVCSVLIKILRVKKVMKLPC